MRLTVAAGCQNAELSLVSYESPTNVYSPDMADQEVLYRADHRVLGPGDYTLTVDLPSCFYQVDFVFGAPIEHLGPAGSNNFYSKQGRLIESFMGGSACQQQTTTTVATTTTAPTTTVATTTAATTTVATTTAATTNSTTTTNESTTTAQSQSQQVAPVQQTTTAAAPTTAPVTTTTPTTPTTTTTPGGVAGVHKTIVHKAVKQVKKTAKPAKAVVKAASFTG